MIENRIFESVTRLSNWLDQSALPFWSNDGFDDVLEIFHERVDFKGRPQQDLPRRLMVQCRQISVLAHSRLRGRLDEKLDLIKIFDRVTELYYDPDRGTRWCFSINQNGAVVDDVCDSYSLGFVMFCLSWLYRLDQNPKYIALADEIIEILYASFSDQDGGVASDMDQAILSQNPNMHLLEAYIAMFEATGRDAYLLQAEKVAAFFCDKLYIHSVNAVPENHSEFWGSVDEHNSWFEPGHHFEWICLLRQLTCVGGKDFEKLNCELKIRAISEGIDEENLAIERVDICSGTRTTSRRLWGTCEYIKLCANEVERALAYDDKCATNSWTGKLTEALDSLYRNFLDTEIPGLWIDRIDDSGASLSLDVPASSFYHLAFSIIECERTIKRYVGVHSKFMKEKRGVLFLDRDGVINIDTRYASKPEQIFFRDDVAELIRVANDANLACVVVSNQSGVARGYFSEMDILNLHRWMNDELKLRGACIEAWYYCPYHFEATSFLYKSDNHYDRKPNGGLILRAALELNLDLSNSYLIGDQQTDIEAGRLSGVRRSFLMNQISDLMKIIR